MSYSLKKNVFGRFVLQIDGRDVTPEEAAPLLPGFEIVSTQRLDYLLGLEDDAMPRHLVESLDPEALLARIDRYLERTSHPALPHPFLKEKTPQCLK